MELALCLPVYNNSETLLPLLDSLLGLEGRDELEVIISDDCSTDDTGKMTREWVKMNRDKFRRVVFVESPENCGVSANHQLAFSHVQSSYAFYIGGDDLIENSQLLPQLAVQLSLARPAIAKLKVQTYYPSDGRRQDIYDEISSFFSQGARTQFAALVAFGNFVCAGPGTIVNMQVFREIGGFDSDFRSFEDYPLFLRFIEAGHPIALLDVRGITWVRSMHSLSLSGFWSIKSRHIEELELMQSRYFMPNAKNVYFPYNLAWKLQKKPLLYRVSQRACRALKGYPP